MDEQDPLAPRPRSPPAAASGPVVAGRYRVERLIARGGMAAVFLAEHIALRRRVALKILHPPPDADESGNFEKRFRLEAETLATLDHPNIVTLYDYGEAEDGRFYLAMEYIEGPRFTDLLGHGALPPDRALHLLLEVCAALRYAHKRGVVHRDLKPSNLLVGTDSEGGERLKVVDFGLVKVTEIDQSLTREGLVLGSPHCMAPEQVRGAAIDHRADIYAIGILLFRSLTGVYPFHGATSTATMVAHLNEPVPTFASVAPDIALPAALEDIVRRCLAKRPADRPPDVKTLMEELAACIGARPEPDSTSRSQSGSLLLATAPAAADTTAILPVPEVAVARPPRRPAVAILGVLLALSVAGGIYLLARGGTEPPEVPDGPPPAAATAPPGPTTTAGAAAAPAAPAPPPTDPGPTADPAADVAAGATAAGATAAPTGAGATPVGAAPAAAPGAAAPAAPAPERGGRRPARPAPNPAPTGTGTEPPPEGYMPLPDDFK